MKIFRCDQCTALVPFSAQNCPSCGVPVGYIWQEGRIRMLEPGPDGATFHVSGSSESLWRCMNAAWGCNWMVPVAPDAQWCRACQLTRRRPDVGRSDATHAWMVAEAAKRRLLHQLDELHLEVEVRSVEVPNGLAFDFVSLPGYGSITGHLDGIVTIDLAEVDDRGRDDLRRRLGESFRTLIGHLRHEVGHYFWPRLVRTAEDIVEFRRLFGDETEDYTAAVQRYYAGATGSWDHGRFVTAYASCHPLEDWAETFAHLLHVTDAVDTAMARGLLLPPGAETGLGRSPTSFAGLLEGWRQLNHALGDIADALGAAPLYPFDHRGLVVDKLAFVHHRIPNRDTEVVA